MAKGILQKVDNLPSEKVIATLVNLARTKVDLIEFRDDKNHHFLLRKIKFLAPNNIHGSEIKIGLQEAALLSEAIRLALSTIPAAVG